MAPSGLGCFQLAAPLFGADFVREVTYDAGGHNENKCSGRGERSRAYTLRLTVRINGGSVLTHTRVQSA